MFSLPRGTEMFQFPRFPPLVLCVQTRVTPHDGCGVSPFGYPRIDARSTAPRGFSQSPTSFIGSRRQGIHRWLFVAWKSKMLVLAMEFSRCTDDGREAPRTERRRRPAKERRAVRDRCGPRGAAAAGAHDVTSHLQNGTEGSEPVASAVGGRILRRPSELEVRVVSGQLGAPWKKTTPA